MSSPSYRACVSAKKKNEEHKEINSDSLVYYMMDFDKKILGVKFLGIPFLGMLFLGFVGA